MTRTPPKTHSENHSPEPLQISLITAAHPQRLDHLPDTSRSIEEVRRRLNRTGTAVEWIVVVDGPGADQGLVSQVKADRVHQLPIAQGVSAARNHGLAMSRGEWVFPVDADDMLDANGFESLATQAFDKDIVWVATNRLWLDDRSHTPRWINDIRRWRQFELEEEWTSPFPFHPNNMMVRRNAALAHFGWPGLGVNEDVGYCLLASAVGAGLSLPISTLLYRRWEGQTIRTKGYHEAKVHAFQTMEAVINARRLQAGLPPIKAPSPSPL
ncbi:glycosyltransferase family 2 protein [Streptomyces sp. NPDC002602]|uniref:glycosyltransferase family 2 protein n=1 Tax=Streptomyces sp. NPDC002602 TaxID=3364654 RepID=UPI00368314DA